MTTADFSASAGKPPFLIGAPANAANTGAATPTSEPATLAKGERGWSWWVGTAISVAILVVAVTQLAAVDVSKVRALLPTSPLFWLVFAASYLAAPFFDWVIFRRLWQIPVDGFAALLRKLIGNELLFGYAGELYLYTWARRRTEMTTAPFGAIKDVAILSAMTGNAVTMALLVLAYPLLGTLHLGIQDSTLLTSVAVVLGTSSVVLFLRKTLFSLPRADLNYVAWMHLARIFAGALLNAWAWHIVLPDVALQWWLLLSAMRMLLSRLPLLPNKDIVFAGLAVFLIGHDAEMGTLMTLMASLILGTHLVLGLLLVSFEALGWTRR